MIIVTNSMEQSPWEANSLSPTQTGPYTEPGESSLQPHTVSLEDSF
jgi:hypothetical protein